MSASTALPAGPGFQVVGIAHGTRRCRRRDCRGHAGQPVSAEIRTHAWTRRTGNGPLMIGRTEELPVEFPEPACEFCGGETEIIGVETAVGTGSVPGIHHPVPHVSPGMIPDEVLPDPAPEPTLEQRVAELEREVARLKSRF